MRRCALAVNAMAHLALLVFFKVMHQKDALADRAAMLRVHRPRAFRTALIADHVVTCVILSAARALRDDFKSTGECRLHLLTSGAHLPSEEKGGSLLVAVISGGALFWLAVKHFKCEFDQVATGLRQAPAALVCYLDYALLNFRWQRNCLNFPSLFCCFLVHSGLSLI